MNIRHVRLNFLQHKSQSCSFGMGDMRVLGLAAMLFIQPVFAQAACNIPGVRVAIESADWLIRRPSQLLDRYPRGEEGLMAESLAFATNPTTLKALMSLTRVGNAQQKRALGEGLGRAAHLCQRYDQSVSRNIRELVETTGDAELRTTFRRTFQIGAGAVPPSAAQSSGLPPLPSSGAAGRSSGIYDDNYVPGRALGQPKVGRGDSLDIPAMSGVVDPFAKVK